MVAQVKSHRYNLHMENARVVIFEDNERIRLGTERTLIRARHTVVAYAGTVAASLAVVEQLRDPDNPLTCDIIILDGNIDKGSAEGDDARTIFDATRRFPILSAKIIGNSLSSLREDYGIPVNADAFKDPVQLLEIIESL